MELREMSEQTVSAAELAEVEAMADGLNVEAMFAEVDAAFEAAAREIAPSSIQGDIESAVSGVFEAA